MIPNNEFARMYLRDLAGMLAGIAGREVDLRFLPPGQAACAARLEVGGAHMDAVVLAGYVMLSAAQPPGQRRLDGPYVFTRVGRLCYRQGLDRMPDRQSLAAYLSALRPKPPARSDIVLPVLPDGARWVPRREGGGWRLEDAAERAAVVLLRPECRRVDGRDRPYVGGLVEDRRSRKDFAVRRGALLPVWRLTVYDAATRPVRIAYFDGPEEAMRWYRLP